MEEAGREERSRSPSVEFVIGAYPPSVGGAQLHTQALAQELDRSFGSRVSVRCLWRETRHDWLLGSTLRLSNTTRTSRDNAIQVIQVGLNRGGLRDYCWAAAYYFLRMQAARYFAKRLDFPPLEGDITHVVRLGREHLAMRSFMEARRVGRPLVITPNHHLRWSRRPDPAWRWMYREADHVFALTEVESLALQALGVGEQRLTVTGIGPVLSDKTMSRSEFLTTLNIPDMRFLGYLGQQFPYKRLDLVVEVFDELADEYRDLALLIAGPSTPQTERFVTQSPNPNRIFVLGEISIDLKTAMLNEIDVLLFPSEQEAFGGVLLEAAWMGTPYVASNIPTLREAVSKIGLGTSSSLSVPELVQSVRNFLHHPPGDGEKAQVLERLESHYSWQALAKEYLAVYEGLS